MDYMILADSVRSLFEGLYRNLVKNIEVRNLPGIEFVVYKKTVRIIGSKRLIFGCWCVTKKFRFIRIFVCSPIEGEFPGEPFYPQ